MAGPIKRYYVVLSEHTPNRMREREYDLEHMKFLFEERPNLN